MKDNMRPHIPRKTRKTLALRNVRGLPDQGGHARRLQRFYRWLEQQSWETKRAVFANSLRKEYEAALALARLQLKKEN